MQDFKKLRVWHLAHRLSVEVIEALSVRTVRRVPGLRSQAVRAANSVKDNIAEGCGRPGKAEFLNFVGIAIASANELESQLELARDTRVLTEVVHASLTERLNLTRRMLISLMRVLERQIAEEENRTRRRTG